MYLSVIIRCLMKPYVEFLPTGRPMKFTNVGTYRHLVAKSWQCHISPENKREDMQDNLGAVWQKLKSIKYQTWSFMHGRVFNNLHTCNMLTHLWLQLDLVSTTYVIPFETLLYVNGSFFYVFGSRGLECPHRHLSDVPRVKTEKIEIHNAEKTLRAGTL